MLQSEENFFRYGVREKPGLTQGPYYGAGHGGCNGCVRFPASVQQPVSGKAARVHRGKVPAYHRFQHISRGKQLGCVRVMVVNEYDIRPERLRDLQAEFGEIRVDVPAGAFAYNDAVGVPVEEFRPGIEQHRDSGIGLERWTAAFLAQKGLDSKDWPEKVASLAGEPRNLFKFL